jgi:hypothetical protein
VATLEPQETVLVGRQYAASGPPSAGRQHVFDLRSQGFPQFSMVPDEPPDEPVPDEDDPEDAPLEVLTAPLDEEPDELPPWSVEEPPSGNPPPLLVPQAVNATEAPAIPKEIVQRKAEWLVMKPPPVIITGSANEGIKERARHGRRCRALSLQ